MRSRPGWATLRARVLIVNGDRDPIVSTPWARRAERTRAGDRVPRGARAARHHAHRSGDDRAAHHRLPGAAVIPPAVALSAPPPTAAAPPHGAVRVRARVGARRRHPAGRVRDLAFPAADRRRAEPARASGACRALRWGSTGTRSRRRPRWSPRELAALDLRDVALVAHSKGGLIGKHLLAYDDPDGRVDRLVAVATPFGGSRLARYAVGSTLRAFLPGDPVIRGLAGERAVQRPHHLDLPALRPEHPGGVATRRSDQRRDPAVGALPHPDGRRRRSPPWSPRSRPEPAPRLRPGASVAS